MKQQREIEAHLAYVRSQKGHQWHVRIIYDQEHGWRVEWHVSGIGLKLGPVAARQLVRNRIADLKKPWHNVLSTEERSGIEAWFNEFDRLAKEALRRNRTKAMPEGVAA
ncbi:MAG TPA: hypothetical protein DEQ40_09150 [Oxalobacteraceae bacterium]|jgi:hypothetical protein|nr:hypothetical protein [Oxalobacteraceae bacterium]